MERLLLIHVQETGIMKNGSKLIFALCCSAVSTIGFGQHPFNNCSAAFLNNKMVVNEYSTQGKCILPLSAI
ncbi:hypothetical protein SAMN05216167_107147 [Spirosoma endophyticum]|uniref:Uncharacterized protein n=1 Tax=Spirosoma endophyticum TaxID=662367 RepID=A0A1I1VEC3_9BACT|nr:hypothetical protein SAMN05216167_107147 [Spirosoma endophyticum]